MVLCLFVNECVISIIFYLIILCNVFKGYDSYNVNYNVYMVWFVVYAMGWFM